MNKLSLALCGALLWAATSFWGATSFAWAAPATYGAWHSAQIGGGGYVQNISATADPKVFYAYVDVGGVYRSDDGGRRWRMLHGGLPQGGSGLYCVRDLNVNPANPNDVIVATGWQWDDKEGVFRTTDGGRSWTKVLSARFLGNENFRWGGHVIARDPRAPAELIAASFGEGVWRSHDSGVHWKNAGLPAIFPVEIAYDRADSKRVWLCAQEQKVWDGAREISLSGGYYRSEDGGANWNKVAPDAPIELLQDPLDAAKWWGIVDYKPARSTDGGATWTRADAGLPQQAGAAGDYASENNFQALAAGPDFVVTASTRGTFYRWDKGATQWRLIERAGVVENYEGRPWVSRMEPGKWQHFGAALGAITVDPRDPKHWFFTDWFAIYQSRDAGLNWDLSMDGVEVTVIHALAQDPTDAGVVHLGMADNGYFLSSDGGADFQKPSAVSNAKTIDLSPLDPRRVYVTGDGGDGQWRASQVWVSADRGLHFTRSPMTGLPDMSAHSCNSLAVNPADPFAVWLGISGPVAQGGGVYRSDDGGRSWTARNEGLPAGAALFAHQIFGIGRELACDDKGHVVAISRDAAQIWRYNGQHWSLARTLEGAPFSVAATPDGTFFVASESGIYRSVDAGAQWTRVLAENSHYVAVDRAHANRIAAGTSWGVQLSLDGGTNWRAVDANLPYKFQPIPAFAGERLLVGTLGNGAFWMPLAPIAATPIAARPLATNGGGNGAGATRAPAIAPNGDMTQGEAAGAANAEAAPLGWGVGWNPVGRLQLARDTTDFVSGPASLRLQNVGGAAQGSAGLNLQIVAEPLVIMGALKVEGAPEDAQIAVQSFDKDGQQIGWAALGDARGAREWRRFSGEVSFPPATTRAQLVIVFKGQGKIWLDDVQANAQSDIWQRTP